MKWNLEDIVAKKNWDQLYKEVEEGYKELGKWWKKLEPEMTTKEFGEFLEFDEQLGEKGARLGGLPGLLETVELRNQDVKLMKSKVTELGLKYASLGIRIGHWIKGLPVEGKKTLDKKNVKRLFGTIPDLEYGLRYSREMARYSLETKIEEVITNKDAWGVGQLTDMRDLIEAGMKYELKIPGKKMRQVSTQSELLKMVRNRNPEIRKAAYRALFLAHKGEIDKLFLTYQAIVKDWAYEAKLRGYHSPISSVNLSNHISDKAVETLLKVCTDNRKIFWEYFKIKARVLGVKKMSRWDVYAPIPGRRPKARLNLEQAKEIVLTAFEEFSPNFANKAKQIFERGHVDSHPRKNKRSGAFCATISPKIPPYVLLNFTNTDRDVLVVAHELGHAVHSLYAENHYPSAQQANLPLAETASTLGELIVFEKLLVREKDPKVKRAMIWEKLADSFATILRQNYFVIFEMRAHEAIKRGTTAEGLSKLYLQTLKEEFGGSVSVDPLFKYEWCYISHIFESPFYCYAYNFGELLTTALYGRYKREGVSFAPKIEALLAAGGSRNPNELLKELGIDIEKEEFWENSFEVIKSWIKQLGESDDE